MYCVKCGVNLADTEKKCPLCLTRVCHPDFQQPDVTPLYPENEHPAKPINRWSIMLVVSILYLLPMSICLVIDLSLNGKVEWSGYVIGGMLILYAAFLLPRWFAHPNPAFFLPVVFVLIGAFLLYLENALQGNWFLSFALPITGTLAVIFTALTILCRYIRRQRLYIFGGFCIVLGGFCVLLECLLHNTFGLPGFGTWSPYPLLSLTIIGIAMIVTASFRPLREALEKRLFL